MFSKLLKVIVPTAVGYATGGPAGAFAAGVGASQSQQAEKKFKQQQGIKAQVKADENLKNTAMGVFKNENELKDYV